MAAFHQAPEGAAERPPGPGIGFSLWRHYCWQIELDLRALKVTLGMDVLRCQTPALVRKEVWAHLWSYNLARGVMAEADCLPREVSLAGAVQQHSAYLPYLAVAAGAPERARLWQEMLRAGARHRVGTAPTGSSRACSSGGIRTSPG